MSTTIPAELPNHELRRRYPSAVPAARSSPNAGPGVVIVGASLAGVRAAKTLRRRNYEGSITIIGAERHQPYDRPPLSKRFLAGTADAADVSLRLDPSDDVHWLLGQSAARLDLAARRVVLAGGTEVAFDQLVIATGAHPRTLPSLGEPAARALAGVHVLRTLDDAIALREDLGRQPRVAVIGAGFIGLEVASTCRQRGLDVTVIEFLDVPLARAIGARLGMRVAELHRAQGVTLRLGIAVDGLVGTDRVEGVRLAGGEVVAADVVVVGVGVTPTTGWLEGSGVDLSDGVLCDRSLRVSVGGRPQPGMVAAGDVARWHHAGYEETVRVEHWTNAAEQGEAAAATLLLGDEAPAFVPVPYFWSDQYRTKLQFVGRADPGDDIEVTEGSIDDDRFVATYGRAGRLVAALGFSRPARVMAYSQLITAGSAFPVPPG